LSVNLLNDFGVGNFNLTAITETIGKAYKGKNDVTLSNYDGTGAPVVYIGSVFDNNGALYIVSGSDETPTGYAGITVSSTFYLVFDVSALAFIYTSTAPTWNDALQGWYNGNDRYLFSMYKDSGGTLYENKRLLTTQNNINFSNDVNIENDLNVENDANISGGLVSNSINTDNVALKMKTVSASVSSSSTSSIAHGLTSGNIRGLSPAFHSSGKVSAFGINGSNLTFAFDGTVSGTLYCIISYIE